MVGFFPTLHIFSEDKSQTETSFEIISFDFHLKELLVLYLQCYLLLLQVSYLLLYGGVRSIDKG